MHTSLRMPARWAFSLALCGASLPALAAGPVGPFARTPDAFIAKALGVSAYTIQPFVAPPNAAEGFDASFNFGGAVTTLRFAPTEIHTPDCVMSVDVGGDELIDLPPPPAGIYEGEVVGGPGTSVAQMLGGRLSALVQLPGATWFVQPLTDVIPSADPTLHLVVASEHLLGDGHACGNTSLPGKLPGAFPGTGAPGVPEGPGQLLLAELACESDFQFSDLHSLNASATAQDIARVVAWTGKYFTEGANVKFRINKYVIRLNPLTNPYTTTNPGMLLAEFRTHWNLKFPTVQRDTAHLFTGRELDGTVIGIAALGAVCNTNAAYALSQSLYSPLLGKRASLTAHEIGHNFSGSHCDDPMSPPPHFCAPCRIMLAASFPGQGPLVTMSFGCSGPLIDAFAQQLNCLEPVESAGGGICRPDLTFDGFLSVADFAAFQNAFIQGWTLLADFSHDGQLTAADFGAFQSAFAAGCP